MKKCAIIYNPNSGKKKIKFELDNYKNIFLKYEYDAYVIKTKYKGHAKEIIASINDDIDLVLVLGGDGTFNEVVTGNLKRKNKLVLAPLPYGTTNDIGSMFGLTKNIEKNLNMILSGTIRKIDIASINNNPFVYVAGFGRFLNIAYDTPRKLKSKLGYIAYIFEAIKDFIKYATHLYDITYELDGKKYNGLFSLCVITNANRIGGINNFYKDIKLDDKNVEVLLCNLKTKKDFMRSLFYLKNKNITEIPGFYFYKAKSIKIKFNEKLRRPWCIDGERLEEKELVYEINTKNSIELMLPKSVDKRLFKNED